MLSLFHNVRSQQPKRRTIPFANGIALLFGLVLMLGTARTSQASCGDWLEMTDHRSAESVDANQADDVHSIPCDCQGPMCDAQDPGPLPLPARDVELSQQRNVATLNDVLESELEFLSWKAVLGRAAERDGYPCLIDRPPRAA